MLFKWVDFINIRARLLYAHRMRGFFGAQCLVNGEHILQKVCQFKLLIWSFNCWWNWMEIFLPNAVRRQLFDCQKKFDEINPPLNSPKSRCATKQKKKVFILKLFFSYFSDVLRCDLIFLRLMKKNVIFENSCQN